jgi:glycerate 2-kinase
MHILICPDSFKECLSAGLAAEHISKGIQRASCEAEIKIIPLADGGEGTVDALIQATGGKTMERNVHDPLGREMKSFFGILGDNSTAVIEMAAASGIGLLKVAERNPWITCSFGTGELISCALDEGCKTIILGAGGSATNDGGMGALRALGVGFFDRDGRELARGGGSLCELDHIDISRLDSRMGGCTIYVACDVSNTLTGESGASKVYGPQKGADERMAGQLDRNLRHYAAVIKRDLGRDIEFIPGSGAAGGLGGGMMVFQGAAIRPGFEIVCEFSDLERWIQWADLIITGEGKIDYQTQYGKTPMGVLSRSVTCGKPVIAFVGSLGRGHEILYEKGLLCAVPVADKPMSLEESIRDAGILLEAAAERTFRLLQQGRNLPGIR